MNRQDKQKYKKSCLAKEECNAADTEAALFSIWLENFGSGIQYKKQGSNLTLDADHLSWVSLYHNLVFCFIGCRLNKG